MRAFYADKYNAIVILHRSKNDEFRVQKYIFIYLRFSVMQKLRPPRYLRIAEWLLNQDQFMTSRDISKNFNISVKVVCADFILIRKRPDIIEAEWRRYERGGYGKIQYRMRVLRVHPYWLDARNCPRRRQDDGLPMLVSNLMPLWQMLVTTHWSCLDLHKVSGGLARQESVG